MTIREAVAEARKDGNWVNVPALEPAVVVVCFRSKYSKYDHMELDLYNEDKEDELDTLWESLYEESGAVSADAVNEVTIYCI